ncbi:MAG TPA: ABC transporter ATP-binding protein [Nocardioidaceae bacterium]|nr:ABC transporter ATP-binding protein [Nocardioidaceae bacterium]
MSAGEAESVRTAPPSTAHGIPAVRLSGATLAYGERTLWSGLDLDVRPGQFLAILGPNGGGKTSLLKVLLGLEQLRGGTGEIAGSPLRRGNPRVGYIPQLRGFDSDVPLRARDLVGLGLDGHRWGVGWPSRARRQRVDELLEQVDATAYADVPLGRLSGGEQQRLRVAQALSTDPGVLLCDEPLLSLDLAHQRMVVDLIDRRRREHDTAVLFVTHEINPILPLVDLVLYVIDGEFRLGPPDEVMTGEVLSELYGAEIEVIRREDRIVVLGAASTGSPHHHVDHSEGAPIHRDPQL